MQQIIVFTIILLAIAFVVFNTYKQYKNKGKCNCGSCGKSLNCTKKNQKQ